MSDPYDFLDKPSASSSSDPYSFLDGAASKPADETSAIRRLIADPALSLAKGVIGAGEGAVGLADLVSGGHAGKGLHDLAGYDPKEAKATIDEYLSSAQRAANEKVQGADGFVDTTVAALQNPSTIAHSALESLPSMLGPGSAVKAVAPKIGAIAAGAIGEGLITAGQNAEQVRQETSDQLLSAKQAGSQALAGLFTGAIAHGGGKLANRLGIGDIDTILAGGPAGKSSKGFFRRLVEGGLSEGVFEELPQSAQEQLLQNYALDKPLTEGVGNAAAMGMLTGAAMGGPTAALLHGTPPPPPAATPTQTAGMDQTNAEADSSLAAYAGMNAAPAGLIPSVPSVIVPPSLGGAAAVAPEEKGKAGQVEQMATEEPNFLKAYTTQAQAQQNLEQRADKDRLAVTPHPRVDGAFAVVSKSQQELDTQDAKAKAGTSAETRNATVTSEEEAVSAESKRMDALAHEAATSPLNKIPMPSEEQIKSGNYKKGKVKLHGLTVAIENPAGSIRSGVTPDGKPWSTKLKHHYGYIKGTVGADKDHVDVFLTPQAPHASLAWVIDQKNKDGSFDEHKVVLGPDNMQAAKDAYLANYQAGWDGFGAMTAMTMEQFKSWVSSGKTHVPLAYVAGVTTQDNQQATTADAAQTELAPAETQKMVTPVQEKADKAAKLRAQMEAKTRAATLASEETAVETEAKQVATAAKSATKPGKSSSTLAAEQAAADEAAQNELAPAEVQSTAEILADKIKRDEVTARLKAGRDAKAASKAKKAADFKANLEAAAAKKAGGEVKKSSQRATDAMRAKGELTADQEITNVERADLPNANEVPKGAMSKQLLDSLTRLAKLFGKTVQIFSGPITADGFVIDNKIIYINVNSKVAHAAVMGHELLHMLKHDVPQAYAALARVIRANMSKESWDKFEKYYNDPALKGDALIEEGVADLMGNRFIEPEFWADVFAQVEKQYSPLEAKAIIRALSQVIVKIINKVINVLGGSAFKTDQFVAGDIKPIKAALVKATAEYMREMKSRGDTPAEQLGTKFAKKAAEERKGRTLDEVRSRVASSMPLAVSPDMRKLLNGADFETLDRSKAGPGLLIDNADAAMQRMMDESVAESLLTPELAKLIKVPTKAYVDKALRLTNGARFWYELSAEGFAGKYFKLARALTEHLIDIVAGTSGGQKPTDNLRVAIAAMAQDKQGLPVTTGVRDPSSLTGALSPDVLTTHKFGNFSDTMQTVAGLRDVKPLPTIDLQMASVFGIKHAEIASNPVMYETLSRFLLKLRDAQNAKLKKGVQPYESWQMQALLWVANRSAADPDSYDIGMPKIVNQLQAAGIHTPGGKITIETLMDPRTPEVLAPTSKSVPETATMTLETNSKRTASNRSANDAFNIIKNITEPWANKLSAEYEMIQRRAMRALGEKQPHPQGLSTKSPSVISQLMALVMGKTLASYDATRVDTEGWGTFEGASNPNIRVPLLLGQRGGSDGKGGTPRFEMAQTQRLQLMSILGKDIKQDAMANSSFVSVDAGKHDTFSILIKRYDKVDITESQLTELGALIGRPLNYSRVPNGWLIDINIGGFDPVTDIAQVKAAMSQFDPSGKLDYHDIPRAFSSDYLETTDYAKHIRSFENGISRDANTGGSREAGRAAQRLSDLTRLREQVRGIVAQQERALKLWDRNARATADKRGVKLSTGRNDGAGDGRVGSSVASQAETRDDSGRRESGRTSSAGTADGAQSNGSATQALQGRLTPFPGAPNVPGFHGPDPRLVSVAEQYASDNGIQLNRQAEYVTIDEDRANRLAAAYEAMPHAPNDPVVKAAYTDLIKQTTAQYEALAKAGYKFWFINLDEPSNQEYVSTPWNAMRDIRATKTMGVFPTTGGFGSGDAMLSNPLEAPTGLRWPVGSANGTETAPVLANDLFRAVHDAFGHGLEGAGFRAQGEENAWQAHSRLFTGPALAALTSETRGQNSWLNYGPHADSNQTAKTEDTVFADQKTGLMPSWTWTEGRAGDMKLSKTRAVDTESAEFKAWFGDSKVVDADGKPLRVYHGTTTDFDEFTVGQHWNKSGYLNHAVFLSDSPEYASGFAGDAGRVMPVYLSITKLKDLTKSGDKDTWKKFISLSDSPSKYIESLKRQGFDGAVIPDYNPSTGEYSKTYIAFSPTQIKSAISNTGAFSSTNPDIRMSPGRATGVHYSKQERPFLSSDAYGTGAKGAEAARVAAATDPRLKHRIYFYVNGGKGINPEFGVGPHAHQADLANLYDMDNDPRDLALGRDANGFESAVLDAGFDGYMSPSAGIAVQLGPRSTRVKYLGMTTPTVVQVENAQPGPRTAAQRAIAARRDLPGGQMTGEAWKAYLPDIDLSHLQDGEKYYKSALVKLSTPRQQDAFADDFATKATTITDTVVVSTKGDTEEVQRSNVNSAGRQIANTKSGLRRFWDWYAGSPEDINGKPILLYHSTAGDITTFETMRETTNTGMFGVPFKSRRAGIFLTPNVRFAESYVEGKANSNTMQVYARMQNPADFRHGMSPDLERALEANGINARAIRQLQYDWEMFEEEYGGPAIVAALKAAGYDGAIINEDDEQGKSQDTYVAFDPEQIKSATGNRGSWNETNPDIRMSKTRAEIAAGADAIKAMSEDQRDNLQPSEAPGGWHAYELYEARKLLQKPTEKLKRVTENNSFILHQDYDSIANVDGVHFGINKYEDPDEPDDDSKFVYAFNRIDDPLNTTETSTDQQDELLTEMRSKLSKTRAVDTESPEFRNWFGDSAVVDEHGNPVVVYHSTSADKDFLRFNKRVGDIGNHFGTVGQAEDRWQYVNKFGGDEKNLRIMPVYLAIKNPLRLTDAGAWNADNLTYQLAEKFPQDATQIRKLKSTKDIREFIQSKGYDGVVYKNTGETAGADEYRRAVQIAKAGLPGEWIASAKHSYSEDDQKHPAYIKWNEAEKAYQQFREDSAEDSYIAFSPTQIKSAISNTGEFDGTNPDIQMSRQRLADAITSVDLHNNLLNGVRNQFADIIAPSQGFNLWHKTVGTQFHKASTNPEFKKVFDLGQKFLDDLQLFAIRAEDRSTSIFPRELLKLGLSAQDNALLGNLLAEGTLMNGADPHTGVVFTDAELRAKGLTDAQIKHYREARAAINESLNSLAGSEMAQHLRIQGAPLSEIERVAKADISLADKHTQFSSLVAALQLANPGKDYSETRKHLKGILSTTTNLQAHGYAPLSRFGKYNVTAWNAAGGVEFFTMTDTMSEARALERQLKQDPNVTRTQTNETDTESFKVFAGVTPDTLELFANHAAAGPINDLMQEYLQMAVSNRSTMKRMIKRGGISGFSSDATRVLASFITSNGRRASTNLHMANLGDAVTEIKQGGVKNEAAKLFEYLKNPGEEAAALRGFLFFNFLGGSIAAGIVNMTQPLLMTLPYLSKYGTAKAGAAMTKALTDTSAFMRGKTVSDPTLQQALLRAKSDGHINPQEIYQMMAAANTGNSSFLGHKFTRVWGANFAITEMFNRTLTFAAAYQLAKDSGSATAYDDAVLAINETQGIYNKGNRPNWARGAVGSTLFTFKQYSISYMEFMKRGWGDGIIPKKQFVLTAAFLMLAAGASGAPGADDLDDIIDTVGNWLGYATNSKRWKRQFLTSVLGKELGEFALVGISRYLPLDVQARLGVGNLIPGTGMFNPTKADKTREVTEVFGPAGGVATGLGDAAAGIAKGDGRGAALAVLPTPMRNAYQAAEMWSTGKYKDRGNKLVTEATKTEAIIKAVGFQPANVATVQRSIREAQGEADIVKSKQTEFMTRISNAIADGDQDGRTEAMADLKSWNENNPEYKVRLNPGAIQQAVKLRRMSKDVRFIKQIPKTIRGRIHEELQQ